MAKKFNNPTQVNERKGIHLLIEDQPKEVISEKKNDEKIKYSTYNVRVRQDYKEKIYGIKGRTGKSFTEIFDMIFDEYFKNENA